MVFIEDMDVSNINFKGYKNLLVENYKDDFTMIAAQLTNEGSPDLTKWHEIQSAIGRESPSDVFVATGIKLEREPEMKYAIFIDDMLTRQGDELKNNKKVEKITLKLYTLLANITKRISNDNFLHQDKEYAAVITNAAKRLSRIAGERGAYEIIPAAAMNTRFQEAAAAFNKIIAITMKNYFRV